MASSSFYLNKIPAVDGSDSNTAGTTNLNLNAQLENKATKQTIFNESPKCNKRDLSYSPKPTQQIQSQEYYRKGAAPTLQQYYECLERVYEELKQQYDDLSLPMCSLKLNKKEQEQVEALTDCYVSKSEISAILGTTDSQDFSSMTDPEKQSAPMVVQNNLQTTMEVGKDASITLTEHQQQHYYQQEQLQQILLHSPLSPLAVDALWPLTIKQQQQQHIRSKSILSNKELLLMPVPGCRVQDQQEGYQQQQCEAPSTSLSASQQRVLPINMQQHQYTYNSPAKSKCVLTTSVPAPQPISSSKRKTAPPRRIIRSNLEYKHSLNSQRLAELRGLIPDLDQNIDVSEIQMLLKAANYIKHLNFVNDVLRQRISTWTTDREKMYKSFHHLSNNLPLSNESLSRKRNDYIRKRYKQHVVSRAQENWKYWLFGLMLEPILSSYNTIVTSSNPTALMNEAYIWADQCYSLTTFRPPIFDKLRYLALNTNILSEPCSSLQEEIERAIKDTSHEHLNLFGA